MSRFSHRARALVGKGAILALLASTVACSGHQEAAVSIAYDPSSAAFWDLPFPSDLRRQPDGSYGFRNYPLQPSGRAATNSLVEMWLTSADERVRDGFGVDSAVYFAASGDVDPSSLPATAADTTTAQASAFLIDVDPASPERGRRLAVRATFRAKGDRYAPDRLIALVPVYGVVRRPSTLYAAVLTSGVRDTSGAAIGRSRPFHDALEGGDAHLAPLVEVLEEQGFDVDTVVSAAVFRTMDPSLLARRIAAWTEKLPAPRLVSSWKVAQEYESYQVLTSTYSVPVIQAGQRPYDRRGDGRIVLDAAGDPVIQGTQEVRLAVTIPKRAQPAGGFPMVMYLHGSGGEWYEGIDRSALPPTAPRREQPDTVPGAGPAEFLARRGLAMAGFDFPIHGNRNDPPDTTGLVFYNLFGNVDATIDNYHVASMELLILSRLLGTLDLDAALASTLDAGGAADGKIRFDPTKLMGMGHSMGATLGVPWAALDPRIKAFFVSGGGGSLAAIAATALQPTDLRPVVEGFLEMREGEQLDEGHPILHAFQNLWDIVDPIGRARHVALEPYAGIPAKHVFMTAGVRDGYFHPLAQNAMAAALGASLAGPSIEPTLPEALGLAGAEPVTFPAGKNRGGMTAVVTHYDVPFNLGHFVAFDREDARHQYTCFLASLGEKVDGPAALDAPCP